MILNRARPLLASIACVMHGHEYSTVKSYHVNANGSWSSATACVRCLKVKREPWAPKRYERPVSHASSIGPDVYRYAVEKPRIDYGPSRARNEAAIAAMNDIERLRMYAHYLIDEAAWRSRPCIDVDGFKYLHATSPKLTMHEFYTNPAFNPSFGSVACWYLECYYTPCATPPPASTPHPSTA